MSPKFRIRTDDPAYPALCAGCEACGRFPYMIGNDLVWLIWSDGPRELARCVPFAVCREHHREPREEFVHRRGRRLTNIWSPPA